MVFHDWWILIFVPFVFVIAYISKRRNRSPGFQFSSIALVSGLGTSIKVILRRNIVYVWIIAIGLMVIALARPQTPTKDAVRKGEGIDIVSIIDVSTSMLAEDFTIDDKRYNRLYVVKKVVSDFIEKRENDRFSIVVFGARAYTACPLTLNHGWVNQSLEGLYGGMLEDRTAIGSAMATALNRLTETKAKSKVIILLTDGRNNAGQITPMTSTEIARALGVKVYTIGVGTLGLVDYPVMNTEGETIRYKGEKIDIDEELLRKIASKTHGKYFRATDISSLEEIYRDIDRLESSPIEERGYTEYDELFPRFLIPGMVVLLLYIMLTNIVLERIP